MTQDLIALRERYRGPARRYVLRPLSAVAGYVFTTAIALTFAIPLLWALSGSLKRPEELWLIPPQWIPRTLQWQNYVLVSEHVPFFRFLGNSFFVTFAAMAGQVFTASIVGYGFSCFRFPLRDVAFMIVLSTMMLPAEVTLIPTYIVYSKIGWLDTYKPLIVPSYFGGGAFTIFLFRQFYMTIPQELLEAAKIDGCNPIRIYWRIMLPLVVPALITAMILSFQAHWNDFMTPLIYVSTLEKYTASVGLHFFRTTAQPESMGSKPTEHLLMAATMMMTLPCLVIFLTLQRYFIRGVVTSGLKG